MADPPPVSERVAAQIWNSQLLSGRLATAAGQKLEVVHRGDWSFGRGPDFRNAMLTLDGHFIKGDVEVHLRSGDWRAHGHEADPGYNSVVLHVVLWNDVSGPMRHNGSSIPTLVLSEHLTLPLEELAALDLPNLDSAAEDLCMTAATRIGPQRLGAILDWAGDERFRAKAARFESELSSGDPGQILYEGLMEAHGYIQNRAPFRTLACLASLQSLENLIRGRPLEERVGLLESLFFGLSGLLPSQRATIGVVEWQGGGYVEDLERDWALLRQTWDLRPCGPLDWTFRGARPLNWPPRRIAAACRLLAATPEHGLVEGLLGPLASGNAPDAVARLTGLLRVRAPDMSFWAHHYDFDRPFPRGQAELTGEARALDIALNVALPFAAARGREPATHVPVAATAAFRAFPRLSENQITSRMASRVAGSRRPQSFVAPDDSRLPIHRMFCAARRCYECPLGGDIAPRAFSSPAQRFAGGMDN